jgi:phage gp36-like protein
MKRLVIAALKGTYNLWMNASPKMIEQMCCKVTLEKLEMKNWFKE